MSKWQALRCLCGWHDWSRWRKIFDGDVLIGAYAVGKQCTQRRFCRACGEAQTRPWRGRKRKAAAL